MNPIQRTAVDNALTSLKDFQQATVDYVYGQMYNNHRGKMLVADEVGLGKTIVAKGLIARSYERHMHSHPGREFHIIYICSNQALAAQNLKRLNIFETPIQSIGRLIYLAFAPKSVEHQFRLSSLTPGTSFYSTRGGGEAEERLILFALLTRYSCFAERSSGLRYLLIGGVRNFEKWLEDTERVAEKRFEWFRQDIFKKFKDRLRERTVVRQTHGEIFNILNIVGEQVSLWRLLKKCAGVFSRRNFDGYPFRTTVIGMLREVLTEICLDYLNANLFILDEFQRYRELIQKEVDSPAVRLAQKVFSIPEAKVLMLSATPFKPYTTALDQNLGEDHYEEFMVVLKFLMQEKDDAFWKDYEKDRKLLFQMLRRPKEAAANLPQAVSVKERLEATYLNAMVRTERLIVSDDRNMMLSTGKSGTFGLQPDDVKDFILTDRVVRELKKTMPGGSLCSPLEYAKSAPFPLSFMDRYMLKEHLEKNKRKGSVLDSLKKNKNCWLDFKKIHTYKPLSKNGLPNGKLRILLDEALYSGGWKLLWIPPALPYYEGSGAYEGMDMYTKTLVFSSWVMVPRMIATLASYEAERLTVGDKRTIGQQERGRSSPRIYSPKGKIKRRPRPQLVFTRAGTHQAPVNMTNFCLLYPSPSLACLYHPRENLAQGASIAKIRKTVANRIEDRIQALALRRFEEPNGEASRWYWAAPLLMDMADGKAAESVKKWLMSEDPLGDIGTDPESSDESRSDNAGRSDHFREILHTFTGRADIGLGRMPEDLPSVLADMVIGSPAVTAYRALGDFFQAPVDVIKGAAIIAMGFLSLFNKPESIAIIRLFERHGVYWRSVLNYCASGNIQALLDEFVFLLFECEKHRTSAQHLAEHFAAVMNIRTSNMRVDSLKSFLNANEKPVIRCHFALDFGNQRIETASGKNRIINLREAFNSPFRPFILASTSIGQEGFDFHYYCRKIMHWNLPSNAIDIEQREGRINRYMGHVIRKNIAIKYQNELTDLAANPWKPLFRVAAGCEKTGGKCDLVPYWHVESSDGIKVERIVPLHPFSKDIQKLKYLLKVLAFYRLTFGQPRQEELVEAIMNEALEEQDIGILISNLMINLSPIHMANLSAKSGETCGHVLRRGDR